MKKPEQLIENLEQLEKHNKKFSRDIQHVKNLIECLNELINNGEIDKNCHGLLNDTNENIQPSPETYALPRKSLGDRSIRLARRSSKTMPDDASCSSEKRSSRSTLTHQVILAEDVFFS